MSASTVTYSIRDVLARTARRLDRGSKRIVPVEQLVMIPPQLRVNKPAAAALIVPPNWETYLPRLRGLPLLMGFDGTRQWWELLGGALESAEEQVYGMLHEGAVFPDLPDGKGDPSRFGGAFYHVQAQALLTDGGLRQLTYNTRGGETDQMAALREVVEEGVAGMTIVKAFPHTLDVAVAFAPTNPNLKRCLQPKFPLMYDPGQFYAVQVVQQRGFLCTIPEAPPELPAFTANPEIEKVDWISADHLVAMSAVKAGYTYDPATPPPIGAMRNSVPLHFLDWLIRSLVEEELEWAW